MVVSAVPPGVKGDLQATPVHPAGRARICWVVLVTSFLRSTGCVTFDRHFVTGPGGPALDPCGHRWIARRLPNKAELRSLHEPQER